MKHILIATLSILFLSACAAVPQIPVDQRTVAPGSKVTRSGTTELKLLGDAVEVGAQMPAVQLVDSNLSMINTASLAGEILLVSIVPSLDTQVCERQTGLLGELKVSEGIRKVTISRDLPFAQNRFANENGFHDILYLSDFQRADFGRASGLLVDEIYLLARSMMVVDRQGTIRYLQVVPDISHLPDVGRAAAEAEVLLQGLSVENEADALCSHNQKSGEGRPQGKPCPPN